MFHKAFPMTHSWQGEFFDVDNSLRQIGMCKMCIDMTSSVHAEDYMWET